MWNGSLAAVTSAIAADASRQSRNSMPDTRADIDPDTSSASITRWPVLGTFSNAR